MGETYKLNELHQVLAEFEYPMGHEQAAAACEDITLQLADGTENLGAVVQRSSMSEFAAVSELEGEVMNLLPRNAVGEPYQSEGEG
jgi:DNA/RNA-binding domain of Phe-tRNA-synthetase-like protein